jgi:hypothetical protein
MDPTPQDVAEARDGLAALSDKRAVQVYRWLFGRRHQAARRPPEGQLKIEVPPQPEPEPVGR